MSGSGERRRHPRIREIVIAAVAAAAGAGLLCLAVPMAAAALAEVPGTAVLERLHRETAGAPALHRLIRSQETSLGWREKGRTWTDLALARIMLGEQGSVSKRSAHFVIAEDALVQGLRLSPMYPHAWMRLVLVRMRNERPAADIARPLGFALDTGPREDRMDMLMVEAGLRCWSELDGHDRGRIADKVRRAWQRDALGTAAVAARAGQTPLLARLAGLGSSAPEPAR